MDFAPFLRQLFVASSPQLAAVSIGGIISYPNVLLHQLKQNDSSIPLDLDSSSWIGSTHGLAGIPSILLPTVMQLRGRKFGCVLSCLFGVIGWIIVYFAQSILAVIIAEAFHGLSTHCLVTASMLGISEMVEPKLKIISMTMYGVSQTFGMALGGIIGQYCHWKTVAVIMGCPITLALVISLIWPESPAWLAYKGQFDKCEQAFTWLRGTDMLARAELNEIISAQKERLAQNSDVAANGGIFSVWLNIRRRDFYMPCLHMFVILCFVYWSGMMVLMIYTVDIVRLVTGTDNAATITIIFTYLTMFIGNVVCAILLKYLKNKTLLISCGIGIAVFSYLSSMISLLQTIDIVSKDSFLCLYCLGMVIIFYGFGASICGLTMSAELIPVKHRGLGGSLYVISICLLYYTSLKLSPYMFLYLDVWGTFLIYAINATACTMFVWNYVPENKHWTLQNIEDFYNHGRLIKRCNDEAATL